jgi:hypothetical protein
MKFLVLLITLFSYSFGFAQKTVFPDTFSFPIKPGKRNYLSGNFGELRSNHFHGGLDIKTDGKTGLPVYSAADGYVSKIVMSTSGYGNVLFVTHPNGYVTVYAHLERFNYAVSKFIKEQQYKKQTFEIEERPNAYRFPVTSGQIIGYSGNTGSSGGPHVHFEIRDTANNLYNPLYFGGFKEVLDDVPPIFSKLAIRPMNQDSRIEGEFARFESSVIGKKGKYKIARSVFVKGLVGIEVVSNDRQSGTHNLSGISCLELYLDGKEVFHYNMDKFPFEESNNINVHQDYETLKKRGNHFQRCYKADGNRLPNYSNRLNGKFSINDTLIHKVKIVAYDAYFNASELEMEIKGGEPSKIKNASWSKPSLYFEQEENYLRLIVKEKSLFESVGIYSVEGRKVEAKKDYSSANHAVFIWDLRNGMPDSFNIGASVLKFPYRDKIQPDQIHKHTNTVLDVHFPKRSIFDTLYLKMNSEFILAKDSSSITFDVHDHFLPLSSYVYLSFNTRGLLKGTEKFSAYNTSAGWRYLGGNWNGNIIDFKTKHLGRFMIRKDETAPQIKLVKKNRKTVMLTIRDNLSGIKSFNCFINGQWVLFYHEHKKNLIWTNNELSNIPLSGELLVKVVDNCGNEAILKSRLK